MDVAISLGATDSKIILTGSAFGNKFTLMDTNRTLPGSAASGMNTITYQQV